MNRKETAAFRALEPTVGKLTPEQPMDRLKALAPADHSVSAPGVSEFDCPVCGELRIHTFMWMKNNYNVYRCNSCGLGRADARDFDPGSFYNEAYYSGGCADGYVDYKGAENAIRREFRSTVELIRRLGPGSGKLLEVGCAYGFFLQEAKPYYDVMGVEQAVDAVTFCRAHGLPNVHESGELPRIIASEGPLDVIVMLDVIEHLQDVRSSIALLSRHLRKGGLFIVTTGDWNSLLARITRESWRLMTPPGHLWYFTPQTLATLFRREGLQLEQCAHPWKIVPIDLILHQGLRMCGIERAPALPGWLRPVGLPANLFDAMRLAFRKIS